MFWTGFATGFLAAYAVSLLTLRLLWGVASVEERR